MIPSVKLEGCCATLEFFLPAGSYATVVLREYMKTGNLMENEGSPEKEHEELE